MKKITLKKGITFCLLILWMAVIFSFSSQNGTESSGISSFIGHEIVENVYKVLHMEKSEVEIERQVEALQFVIRKGAHMTEYALLGIFFLLHACSYQKKPRRLWIWAWIFCILYAATDEMHQLFISGRDGKILDVCIDSIGSLFGVLLFMLCYRRIQKRREQKYVESYSEKG